MADTPSLYPPIPQAIIDPPAPTGPESAHPGGPTVGGKYGSTVNGGGRGERGGTSTSAGTISRISGLVTRPWVLFFQTLVQAIQAIQAQLAILTPRGVRVLGNLPTATGNAAGGGATTLFTLVVPANTFQAAGDHLYWEFRGFFAPNTNAKTVQVQLDGVTVAPSLFNNTTTGARISWGLTSYWSAKTGMGSDARQTMNWIAGSAPVGALGAGLMDFSIPHTITLVATGVAAADVVVENGVVTFLPNQ